MSMEREESFFIDIQKSCRFGKFPGLQLFFGQPGTKAPDCGNFVCEKLFQSFHISGKNYFRASISLATSFRFSRIERP